MVQQHVVTHDDGWAFRRDGSSRVTATFDTQAEAIAAARAVAINQQAELFIHGRNGQIRERRSYGNDECPPRDND
jgi:hypothetical protein